MIYLVDPGKVADGRCILNYPLYGIPPDPCRQVCGAFCKIIM